MQSLQFFCSNYYPDISKNIKHLAILFIHTYVQFSIHYKTLGMQSQNFHFLSNISLDRKFEKFVICIDQNLDKISRFHMVKSSGTAMGLIQINIFGINFIANTLRSIKKVLYLVVNGCTLLKIFCKTFMHELLILS